MPYRTKNGPQLLAEAEAKRQYKKANVDIFPLRKNISIYPTIQRIPKTSILKNPRSYSPPNRNLALTENNEPTLILNNHQHALTSPSSPNSKPRKVESKDPKTRKNLISKIQISTNRFNKISTHLHHFFISLPSQRNGHI